MNYHLTFQATQPFLKAENPHAISTAPPMDGMNAFESFLAFEEANPPLPLIGHYPSNKTVFGEGEVEKVWQVEVTDFGVGTGRWVTIPKTQNIEQFKNDNTRQAIQYTPNKATVDCSTLSGEREQGEKKWYCKIQYQNCETPYGVTICAWDDVRYQMEIAESTFTDPDFEYPNIPTITITPIEMTDKEYGDHIDTWDK